MSLENLFILFIIIFYATTIFIPHNLFLKLVEKFYGNQERSNDNDKPNEVARQSANELFFLRNYLGGISQRTNNRNIEKIFDNIIPNVIPYTQDKNCK